METATPFETLKAQVKIMHKPWANSPAIWIRGNASALLELAGLGYAARNRAGWYEPTPIGLAVLA